MREQAGVNIFGGEVNTGGGSIVGRDLNIGFGPEQVANLIAAASSQASADAAAARRELGELQQRLGLTQGAALAVLRAIGEHDAPIEQLPQKLVDAATHYQRTFEGIANLDPQDPVSQDLVGRAQAAVEVGQFGEADQLLGQAEQAEIAAAKRAQQVVDRRLLRAAKARGTRADIAMTQLRYLEAAQHFAEAAGLVPPGHPEDKGHLLLAQADALRQHGDERGDNAALKSAIAAYRLALQEYLRERVPLQWAMAQNNLGAALWRLGKRERGTARLEEAVAAFRAALQERTCECVPLDWAMAQNNLGAALWRLGKRERGTASLEEAVAAFRAALQERTRECVPLDWATTQMNPAAAGTAREARHSGWG